MDRKLTNIEKDQNRKKFRYKRANSPDSIQAAYQTVIKWALLVLFLFMPWLVNHGISKLGQEPKEQNDRQRGMDSAVHKEAIIQVYAARTWGPKGIFAVHSWIAMKRLGSKKTEVSQVIGWRRGIEGNVVFRETGVPIDSWWGNEATLLVELRGEEVEAIINKVDAAIKAYPWSRHYRLYPGPNSNTFIAWIGLQVPELGLDLPSTAIGKDWRPWDHSLGLSASGSGIQVSLYGLLGTSIGYKEGLEANILGLNFELDIFDLALEIPLFGRYEFWYLLGYLVSWLYVKKWLKRARLRKSN